MSPYPYDAKSRQDKRDEIVNRLVKQAEFEASCLERSMVCSGEAGYVIHERCRAKAAACLCECHDTD
jgi:hypothetical protein